MIFFENLFCVDYNLFYVYKLVKRGTIMNRFELFKLRYNIRLRKCLLNNMLCILSPRNKIVIRISQNLDKHIVKYQKRPKNEDLSPFLMITHPSHNH